MLARTLLTAVIASLAAFLAVRSAVVTAMAERAPSAAARFWPSHPEVLIGLGMEGIGRAAAQRNPPPLSAIERIETAARSAPLAAEPFLVRGVQAQQGDEGRIAERAFREARTRAPRSPAPRYFLAEHYLTSGREQAGLREIAVLARLLPGGTGNLAPFLATYATSPAAVPHLRGLFRSYPNLEQAVLVELAKDAGNAELILSLATTRRTQDGAVPDWAGRLIQQMVAEGEYGRARRLWSRVSGVAGGADRLFNPEFRHSRAPPPFNWTLTAGSDGVAEPRRGGGLDILYYGRGNAVLASQLLVLPPGRYRLAMRPSGAAGPGESAMLRWVVACLPENASQLELSLDKRAENGTIAAEFEVPHADCAAQRIELRGVAGDMQEQVEAGIAGLSLTRTAGP